MLSPIRFESCLSHDQGMWLHNRVKELPEDAIIVEVGTWRGKSTAYMGLACKFTSRKIYAVDTWKGTESEQETYHKDAKTQDIKEQFLQNMLSLDVLQFITPIVGLSHEVALSFDKKIDMLFIDADHSTEAVLLDLKSWLPHCKDTCLVCGHDYNHPTVAKAVQMTFPRHDKEWDIWFAYKCDLTP